jgi:hypothetical protein
VIRKQRPPLVIIEWLDAASDLSEVDEASLAHVERNLTYSAGFMLKRTDRGVFLVTDWLENGEMRIAHFVPNGMIKAIRTVRAPGPRASGARTRSKARPRP